MPSRDKLASAKLLAKLLGVGWQHAEVGPFAQVQVNAGLTLDFMDKTGPLPVHHYCFRVEEAEFDVILERIKAAGIDYRSLPSGPADLRVNTRLGGSNIYWNEPGGHTWEMLTVSYARPVPKQHTGPKTL